MVIASGTGGGARTMKSTITVGFAFCGGRAYSLLCDFYQMVLREVVDITKEEVYNVMEGFLS